MKQSILLLFAMSMFILLIGIVGVNAQVGVNINDTPVCKVIYPMDKATEQVTTIKQYQVYENKTITTIIPITTTTKQTSSVLFPDYQKYNSEMKVYISLDKTQKATAMKPVLQNMTLNYTRPVTIYSNKTITNTIQVPKFESKTIFYIDWANFKIGTKTISVPVYETKTITTNQIKSGYNFDSDTGEFYKMEWKEKC